MKVTEGSIVFVHGTGVRLASYLSTFRQARVTAGLAGIACAFVDCAWGDPLGVAFAGQSLPDGPSPEELEAQAEDFGRWASLFADPLWELEKLGIRAPSAKSTGPMPGMQAMPGTQPVWEQEWSQVTAYRPGLEMSTLLQRVGVSEPLWNQAWSALTTSVVARTAFKHSEHELPEAGQALARAVVARLHQELVAQGQSGPSRELRDRMVQRLAQDWGMEVFAVSDFLWKMAKRLGTPLLERHRQGLSRAVAPALGDILLYQSRGEEIREFIRQKIAAAPGPVTLVAHSLGGIACVDLLALPGAPEVHRLVTFGSQAPLLYELGALASLKPPQPLPAGFPSWLNVYDRNDMLSYVAGRLFKSARDVEVESGQPFPDAHGAYHGNETMWAEISAFMQAP